MKTVADLMDEWPEPKVATLARDLNVTTEHAAQFKRRNSIPVRYWPDLLAACKTHGIKGVDYKLLVAIHSQKAA